MIVPPAEMTSQMLLMTPRTWLIGLGWSDLGLERADARTGKLVAVRGGNLGEATVSLGRVKRVIYSGDSRRPLGVKEEA